MIKQESVELTEEMLQLRKDDKSFTEIANIYGLSRQAVQQRLIKHVGSDKVPKRRPKLDTKTIYPNLAKWMYDNHMTKIRLSSMLGFGANSTTSINYRLYGDVEFTVSEIWFLLKLTGCTFEYLFKTVGDETEKV